MITSINEFRATLESKQTAKDKWWDKNYRELINYASELKRKDWKSMMGDGDYEDKKDLEDTLDAIMDQTGKHKALDLLNRNSIEKLNVMIGKKLVKEGHDGEIGPLNNAKTKEEAEVIIRKWIRTDKEEEDGDYRKFRDVKWLGKTTEDKMDKESMKWEDQYVIIGEVDGEIWMARSSRS
jgi:hypothetical protein